MCIRRSLIPCQVYHLFLYLSFVQETLSVSSVTKEMMKFIADASIESRYVHTKINYERAKHEKEVPRRLKSMEII